MKRERGRRRMETLTPWRFTGGFLYWGQHRIFLIDPNLNVIQATAAGDATAGGQACGEDQ